MKRILYTASVLIGSLASSCQMAPSPNRSPAKMAPAPNGSPAKSPGCRVETLVLGGDNVAPGDKQIILCEGTWNGKRESKLSIGMNALSDSLKNLKQTDLLEDLKPIDTAQNAKAGQIVRRRITYVYKSGTVWSAGNYEIRTSSHGVLNEFKSGSPTSSSIRRCVTYLNDGKLQICDAITGGDSLCLTPDSKDPPKCSNPEIFSPPS